MCHISMANYAFRNDNPEFSTFGILEFWSRNTEEWDFDELFQWIGKIWMKKERKGMKTKNKSKEWLATTGW